MRIRVVIAPALYPSEVLKFAAEGVAGIVLTSAAPPRMSPSLRGRSHPTHHRRRAELLSIPRIPPWLMDAELGNIFVTRIGNCRAFKAGNEAHGPRRCIPRRCFPRPAPSMVCGLPARQHPSPEEVPIARVLKARDRPLPYRVSLSHPFELSGEEGEYRIYKRLCDAMPGQPVPSNPDIAAKGSRLLGDRRQAQSPTRCAQSVSRAPSRTVSAADQGHPRAAGRYGAARHHVSMIPPWTSSPACGSSWPRACRPSIVNGCRITPLHPWGYARGAGCCGDRRMNSHGSRFPLDRHQRFCPVPLGVDRANDQVAYAYGRSISSSGR